MPEQVCMGAMLQCDKGLAPSSLVVLPVNKTMTSFVPAANIMDHKPMVNIMPFGMCTSMANPAVSAATSSGLEHGYMGPQMRGTSIPTCRQNAKAGCSPARGAATGGWPR